MRHLLSIADLPPSRANAILTRAAEFKKGARPSLEGKLVVSAFFEPSTRTRLSFESAALRSGARVLGFADGANTSGAKGESLEDSGRILSAYGDCIVLRHPETGAAAKLAKACKIPVINAGDGAGEHPTQTLLDLFTITENWGSVEGLKICVAGDLRYGRTVHSLVPMLIARGAEVVQSPVKGLELPKSVADVQSVEFAHALDADVVYMTRVQKERLPAGTAWDPTHYRLLASMLGNRKTLIMHPLPRIDEIDASVDHTPNARYFEQAANGVPVRMAILEDVLGLQV